MTPCSRSGGQRRRFRMLEPGHGSTCEQSPSRLSCLVQPKFLEEHVGTRGIWEHWKQCKRHWLALSGAMTIGCSQQAQEMDSERLWCSWR